MDAPHLETVLRANRDAGRKSLVPYLTGGLGEWTDILRAVAAAGADAIEVGIPFSDPVMDGPVIQQANDRALAAGATPPGIFDALVGLDAEVGREHADRPPVGDGGRDVRPLARVVALGEQAAERVERARRLAQDAVRVVVDEPDRAQYFSKWC